MKFSHIILLFLGIIFFATIDSGCYYDKESELYPAGLCDTATIKYTNAVRNIMQTQCAYTGCHAGYVPARGIYLTTYDGLKTIASDGRLLGCVEHQPGYSSMPKNTTKLPDCQISQLRIWVAAGAQNN